MLIFMARVEQYPFFVKKTDAIINLISEAENIGFPNTSEYVAAKGLLVVLQKMAMELGLDNIRVSVLVPDNATQYFLLQKAGRFRLG
jgi:short-subunit dehydrogenase